MTLLVVVLGKLVYASTKVQVITKTRQVMLGAYFTFIHSIPSCPFLTLSFSFKTSNLACVLIYFHSPSLHYMFRLFSHASLSRSLSNLFNPRIFQPCPFYDHFRFNLVPYIPQDLSWSLSRVCVHIILYLFLTIINLITCH